jgi:hypothetical protein
VKSQGRSISTTRGVVLGILLSGRSNGVAVPIRGKWTWFTFRTPTEGLNMSAFTFAIAVVDLILVVIAYVLLEDGELLRPVLLLIGAILLSYISLVEYLDTTR